MAGTITKCITVPKLEKKTAGREEETRIQHFFGHTYAQLVLSKECAILTSILYVVYLTVALIGCLNYSVLFKKFFNIISI